MKRIRAYITLILCCVLTGCAANDIMTDEVQSGVNIIVPYATVTPRPSATAAPDALIIDGDGKVVVNDASVLESGISETVAGSASKYVQLRLGSAGTAVTELQNKLKELGYYDEEVSGVFDAATESAVKLFERGYGIMQTGIATSALQERLYETKCLKYGSDAYEKAVVSFYKRLSEGDVGSNVIAMQVRLQELGYPITEVTGVYDDMTRKAVRKFYKAYGYKPRDYAIVDLQKTLYSADAKVYSEADSAQASVTQAPANDYDLMSGDTGTRVSQLQARLKELGYIAELTGTYDEATVSAVSAFQEACNIAPDGIANVNLQRAINDSSAPKFGEKLKLYTLLQWGDTGDNVAKLQNRLAELGYYSGDISGVFGDEMVAIVKRFQSANGLDETGVATEEFQEYLFSENAPANETKVEDVEIPSLIKGDSGEAVTMLQTRLKDLGFFAGNIDGNYGDKTEKSVKKLQAAMGVPQTGEALSSLINIMNSLAAPMAGEKYDASEDITPLKEGDDSDDVTKLQKRLWELGYLKKESISGNIGTYEKFTINAVDELMKAVGCAYRDGTATVEFQAFLFSDAAEKFKKEK